MIGGSSQLLGDDYTLMRIQSIDLNDIVWWDTEPWLISDLTGTSPWFSQILSHQQRDSWLINDGRLMIVGLYSPPIVLIISDPFSLSWLSWGWWNGTNCLSIMPLNHGKGPPKIEFATELFRIWIMENFGVNCCPMRITWHLIFEPCRAKAKEPL